MARYCVNRNTQPSGDHEVHRESCRYLPNPENRIYLGEFGSCHPAVAGASKHYAQVNGCFWCSRECHTG